MGVATREDLLSLLLLLLLLLGGGGGGGDDAHPHWEKEAEVAEIARVYDGGAIHHDPASQFQTCAMHRVDSSLAS